jgi:ubiquinone/menaquinone biosynthesis C-methylase UbiE
MTPRSEQLREHVISEFSSPLTQAVYKQEARRGLWPSEAVVIKTYFQPGSRVLDVGCGTGRTTIPLYQQGYEVVGVDITPAMIDTARSIASQQGLAIKYEVGDATHLPYHNESFDHALFSFNGWAQIPGRVNRAAALNEIYRVLRPGGHYIFTTHIRKFKLTREPFWIKQWMKCYVLKPLGWPIQEEEFGDRFFDRLTETDDPMIKTAWAGTRQRQYVHISTDRIVQAMVHDAGFRLIKRARGTAIAPNDPISSPMFYICEKPE